MSEFEAAIRRYWSHVVVGSVDECWPYTGPGLRSESGHVRVRIAGQRVYQHRLSYRLTYGEWPKPMCLHSCDNPVCANPLHLSAGDGDTNVLQRELRARRTPYLLKGPANPLSKLSADDVAWAVEARGDGIPVRAIASTLNVSVATVYTALRRHAELAAVG